jgi:glycosyltransferase involved in cell wall biosynthesis
MNRPKIAYITTIGMSLRYLLLDQLFDLQAAGYDVIAISTHDADAAFVKGAGIRHIPVPITRKLTPLADLRSLWRLYRALRQERCTIVHTHTPKPGLLGQIAARMAGVPIVVNTIHGFYFHEGSTPITRHLYVTLEKIAARCSTLIFSVNQEDLQTAVREGISPPSKLRLLGPGGIGVDLKRFDRRRMSDQIIQQNRAALHIPHNALVVGFVGRLVAEKGLHELMAAMRSVRQSVPQIRLLIIGPHDSEKADAITPAVAQQYDLGDICIFTGARQDMPELYALMDVFVLPSHREGFPVSPMEASAMAVPSIVTNVRGCREAVEHEGNGLIIPLGDVPALAEAITDLLTHPERRARLASEARRVAEERFDRAIVFQNVRSTYQELLVHHGLASPTSLSSL